MKPNEAFNFACSERIVATTGPRTGNPYMFREFTYGVLVPDHNHPLVAVSVANSSLSIDLWRGCSFQCKYCHVQDSHLDMGSDGKMPSRLFPRSRFSISEILDALELHPYFIKDQTVLSIGTASTEPFASQAVESTFELMEEIVQRGWSNPIWIVTKAGFPKKMGKRLSLIASHNKVMLSFCWAGNPETIEPARNDRFANIKDAKSAGATCAWYMRPMTKDWGANESHVQKMMQWVIEKGYDEYIDMIVPGGLRWTPGIEYGLVEVHGIAMPNIAQDDNQKDLPEEIWEAIHDTSAKMFPDVPVFRKSSCALSHMLGIPDIRSVYVSDTHACSKSQCSSAQRNICGARPVNQWTKDTLQELFNQLSIPALVQSISGTHVHSTPSLQKFSDTIATTVKKMMAYGPSILSSKQKNF